MKNRYLFLLLVLFFIIPLKGQRIISFKNGYRMAAKVNDEVIKSPIRNFENVQDGILKVDYQFDNALETSVEIGEDRYSLITIKEFGMNIKTGCPQLPGYSDIIPIKSSQASVAVIDSTYVEHGDFNILPAQQEDLDNYVDSTSFVRNDSLYSTDTFYPKNIVEIQDVQYYRNQALALVRVNPVQYNPVTKTIRCFSNISYLIDGVDVVECINSQSQLSRTVDGNDNFYTTTQEKYIIVTTNNYVEYLDTTLAQWKRDLGFKVAILSKPNWSSSSEVKTAIKAEYDRNDNTIANYLLVVGGYEDVPADTCYKWWKKGVWQKQDPYFSDHYYSCMNGNGDYWPDIARGRLPIRNINDLRNYLEKMSYYNSSQVYTGKGALCAEFEVTYNNDSVENKRFVKTSEEIRDYLKDEIGYNEVKRVYYAESTANPKYYNNGEYSDGTPLPEDLKGNNYPWNSTTSANVVNSINSGIDFILYRGHGLKMKWDNGLLSVDDIASLNNSHYPFVFSLTCHTGCLYDMEHNCSINGLAMSLITAPQKGAIGAIAATHSALSGCNDVFAEAMFNAIYPNPGIVPYLGPGTTNYSPYTPTEAMPIYAIGDIMNEGFVKLIQCYDLSETILETNKQIETIQTFHYFGEPNMYFYTGTAFDLNNVDISETDNVISVNTNGLDDCAIILKPKETDDSLGYQKVEHLNGIYTFPKKDCDYKVIIKRHNCRPIIKEAPGNSDIYLQNCQQIEDVEYIGRNIYAGKNVTSAKSEGEYVVKNGANLTLEAEGQVTLSSGFSVEKGAELEIK